MFVTTLGFSLMDTAELAEIMETYWPALCAIDLSLIDDRGALHNSEAVLPNLTQNEQELCNYIEAAAKALLMLVDEDGDFQRNRCGVAELEKRGFMVGFYEDANGELCGVVKRDGCGVAF